VLIGGDTKHYQFNSTEANLLIATLQNITDSQRLTFFFTFSRRTPEVVKKLISKIFTGQHFIYDPESARPNPYPEILLKANYIIATPDSISMLSEAVSSGKPTYIFYPETFCAPKHRHFITQLTEMHVARQLTPKLNFLKAYKYEPLDELTKVTKIIKEQFSL